MAGGEIRVSAVVVTLGRSRWLERCLEALQRQGGKTLEILLVAQGFEPETAIAGLADRVLRLSANVGFARANNLAFGEARGDYLATVNDDAIVAEGWLAALVAALVARPEIGAVQGVNVVLEETMMGDPMLKGRIDGCGLAWNRSWQAVQIGRGEPLLEAESIVDAEKAAHHEPREIFGVSATAALYRRRALDSIGGADRAFDERLFAYYEDVDLAVRLHAAGHPALLVPSACARHAGSVTGQSLGWRRWRWIYGNRLLVLASLLGVALWRQGPRILGRDLADLWKALRRVDAGAASGIVAGWGRALIRAPGFVRGGPPMISPREFRRWRNWPEGT